MQIQSAPYWMTSQQQRFPSLDGIATSMRTGELSSVDRLEVRQLQDPTAADLQKAEELRQGLPKLAQEIQQKNRQMWTQLGWAGATGLATGALAATSHYGLAAAALSWTLVPLVKAWGAHKVGSKQKELLETQQDAANRLSSPTPLQSGHLQRMTGSTLLYAGEEGLQVVPGGSNDAQVGAALQAYQRGLEADGNWSHESLSLYTLAASIAGTPEKTNQALALAQEFDGNWSHASAATFAVAAAKAESPEQARQTHQAARKVDGGWSHDSEATYSVAGAIAGTPEKLENAAKLAQEFDGNWSHRSHAIFTTACAAAGDEKRARQAYELGKEFDGNWSHDSCATFTLGAAIAGDEASARQALALAKEMDGNWSHDSCSMYMVAAAIAGNEEKARLAYRLAQEMDGNWSHDSHARFTVAVAASLNPAKAHLAAAFPEEDKD